MNEQFTKRSSDKQLYKYASELGIKNLIICRLKDVSKFMNDQKINNLIINLDNDGNGTHWVSVNKSKSLYFDSYAQSIPESLMPFGLKQASTVKELQNINSETCGWLCLLFLQYVNFKTVKQFYKLFKDVYI